MSYDIISELANSFFERNKIDISANDLIKIAKGEIKVWAWCEGMGSDANIFFIREDGSLFGYDHYKRYGYGKQVDEFHLLRDVLCEQGVDWEVIPCRFSNNLYIHPTDKVWLESLCKDLKLLLWGNPYACLECICRELESNSNTE